MNIKPTINTILPIDTRYASKITFDTSGNLPYKNKLTLYIASTQEAIWEDTVEGSTFFHDIPANLSDIVGISKWYNGNKYAAQIITYDIDNNPSVSEKVYFYTLTTPLFEFDRPFNQSGAVIDKTWIAPVLLYQQDEGESLREYQFFLYENSVSQYTPSQVYTVSTSGSDVVRFPYEYKALKNTVYYIRAKGITAKGIPLDTGMIELTIKHVPAEGFHVLQLHSDDNSTVEGFTNIYCIDPNERIEDGFIVVNSEVQLLDKSLTYEHNYKVQRDFTLSLKMSRCKHYASFHTPITILVMRNGQHTITLTSYVYDDDSLRYHLIVDNGLCTNNHYTEPLFVENEDSVVVHIRRIDNLYHIEALVAD